MAGNELREDNDVKFEIARQTLREVFRNQLIYKVPAFQRSYAWQAEQWDELWYDILELLKPEAGSHYMGLLVLEKEKKQTPQSFFIIDGQQRMVTFSIIMLAVINHLNTIAEAQSDDEQAKNKTRSKRLHERYIGPQELETLTYNPRLELNSDDNDFYRDKLVPLEALSVRESTSNSSQKLLNSALEWFGHKLKREYENDSSRLLSFVDTMMDKLFFSIISVPDEGNAYTVFETLNARGVELTASDLLKNHLFSVANAGRSPQAFEEINRLWRSVTSELNSEKVADFIRTYWNSSRAKLAGKLRFFKDIRPELRTREAVFAFVHELNDNAGIYKALTEPNNELWSSAPELKYHIKALNIFKVERPFPLLLAAYRKFADEDFATFKSLLKTVNVITFRNNVIGDFGTRKQERIYHKAALAVNAGNPVQAKEALRELYVEDATFKQLFSQKSFNTSGQKGIIRYILFELEAAYHAGGWRFDFEDTSITIEHIAPQSLPAEHGWLDHLKHDVSRLGNQTLLEASSNRNVENKSYRTKLQVYKGASCKLTQAIAEHYASEWTVATINSRQEYMAKRAVQLWRVEWDVN